MGSASLNLGKAAALASATLVGLMAVAAPAFAQDSRAPAMALGGPAPAPPGFLAFCARTPDQCGLSGAVDDQGRPMNGEALGRALYARYYWQVAFGEPQAAAAAPAPSAGPAASAAIAADTPPPALAPAAGAVTYNWNAIFGVGQFAAAAAAEPVSRYVLASLAATGQVSPARALAAPLAANAEEAADEDSADYDAPPPGMIPPPPRTAAEIFAQERASEEARAGAEYDAPAYDAPPPSVAATARLSAADTLAQERGREEARVGAEYDAPAYNVPAPGMTAPAPAPPAGAVYAAVSAAAPRAPFEAPAAAPSPLKADRALLAELDRVNQDVNHAIRFVLDKDLYGQEDYWHLALGPDGPGAGDCKDYVLEKRRALIAAGVPAADLSIAIVNTSWRESHAVLLVNTDQGELVLDSLSAWIKPWWKVRYSWVERQSPGQQLSWVSIG
jgi:predicted transglutaminase-like cysteine proteinase